MPDTPAQTGRNIARRVVPLFRPYRARVAMVVGLIVLTSTIGIINPLLIQAVFNKALFVPGGPKLDLLYILVAIMAAVPIVNGAIGILQTAPPGRPVRLAVQRAVRGRPGPVVLRRRRRDGRRHRAQTGNPARLAVPARHYPRGQPMNVAFY